jgi:hypothetical protein
VLNRYSSGLGVMIDRCFSSVKKKAVVLTLSLIFGVVLKEWRTNYAER